MSSKDVLENEGAWRQASRPIAYSLILLLAVVCTVAYKLRVDGILACPASGYGSDAYLSDCQASAYGDYDHGAFWFGLEAQARRGVAEADVLLVGSSRLQFAFSDVAIADWFSAAEARYYLLGFSHSETTVFFAPLLSKIQPRAKVYVINVDRFFDDRVSPPTEQILQRRDMLERYQEKQTWQSVHRAVCTLMPYVCGNALAVFRMRETGAWRTKGTAPFEAKDVSDGQPSNVERWSDYASLGEKFLAQLPVDRNCVLLTIVPTVGTKRAEAMAIAEKLGIGLISPRIDGLRTFDGSHLDEPSARRWSAAFLEEAGPQIRKCLGHAQASKG